MVDDNTQGTELIRTPGLAVRRDPDRLQLVVLDGPDTGRACVLGDEAVCVGTDASCDLVLVDGTVSRRHLLARRDAEGVWIRDQDSSNGTFFGGSRVKEITVGIGATIRAGTTVLKVVPREQSLHPAPFEQDSFHGLIGTSRRMREIFSTLAEVAPTDLTLLVEGETGTGKEALAEAVHRASPRRAGPFVVVDCTTIPRELAESELFGHRKGAFTGAVADRTGCFEEANGGTIFIDEAGDLPRELQPKLLRVLERREVKPVGASRASGLDVRVIAASNRNLRDEVAGGNFREDLYYRLAVVSLTLPPLRERADDLPLLIRHFAAAASGGAPAVELPPAALHRFVDYPWPGNIRELRNVVERAVALHRSKAFDPESFLAEIGRGIGETRARSSDPLPFKQAKSQVVDAFEQAYLRDLIDRHDGNVSSAAREARLDRHHLNDLLKKHGIKQS